MATPEVRLETESRPHPEPGSLPHAFLNLATDKRVRLLAAAGLMALGLASSNATQIAPISLSAADRRIVAFTQALNNVWAPKGGCEPGAAQFFEQVGSRLVCNQKKKWIPVACLPGQVAFDSRTGMASRCNDAYQLRPIPGFFIREMSIKAFREAEQARLKLGEKYGVEFANSTGYWTPEVLSWADELLEKLGKDFFAGIKKKPVVYGYFEPTPPLVINGRISGTEKVIWGARRCQR